MNSTRQIESILSVNEKTLDNSTLKKTTRTLSSALSATNMSILNFKENKQNVNKQIANIMKQNSEIQEQLSNINTKRKELQKNYNAAQEKMKQYKSKNELK